MRPPPLRLERHIHHVQEIGFGPRTVLLPAGRLEVNRQTLTDLVMADDRISACNVELASCGERVRVVHICDTVEPQWREQGTTFPGGGADAQTVGHGVSHRLAGVGVTACCELPWRKTGGIQIPRENIAELHGPLAELPSRLGSAARAP